MSTNFGQIGTSYRAKSRWISVRNDGDLEIPPFAPCYFILRVDYQSEEQPIVLPFPGRYRPQANSPHVANPSNYSICFNGPTAIKAKSGFGEVTIDYPCVARVKYLKNQPNDPVKRWDAFAPVFVDMNSATEEKAVSYLSDIGQEGSGYRSLPTAEFYRNTLDAFQSIGVAKADEELYWVVPKERPKTGSNEAASFSGVNESQDVISDFSFNEAASGQEWAYWQGGDVVFNLPGVYSIQIPMSVDEGGIIEAQETTLPTDYELQFTVEKIGKQTEAAVLSPGRSAYIRQPSHLYRINCSGGYGYCPKMDVFRPGVSASRQLQLTITVTEDWKVPTADGKVKAVPLVKLSAQRIVNFDHTGDISAFRAGLRITRGGFDEFYRGGYYGYWGGWYGSYYGYGLGFGWGVDYLG